MVCQWTSEGQVTAGVCRCLRCILSVLKFSCSRVLTSYFVRLFMLHPSNRCRGFASEHSITCDVNPSLHVSKDWMFLCACNVECAKVRAVPTVQMVWIFSRTTWNDIERMNMWGWLRSFRRQKALGKSIAFDSAPGRLSGHLDTRIGRRKRRDQETDSFWCYVLYNVLLGSEIPRCTFLSYFSLHHLS